MGLTPTVAISDSFLTALGRLPAGKQKKVREFTSKFRENPTSSAINYESLATTRDPKVRTVRIDLAYRAVIVHPPKGNTYLLVWVDHHDEAMQWAAHKVFDIHATTGALQVLDMQQVEQAGRSEQGAQSRAELRQPKGLFAQLGDEDLAQLGVPPVLLPSVRAVTQDKEVEALEKYLPPEAYEALFLVACGYDLQAAIRESSRSAAKPTEEIDTEDFAAALARPASRRQFRLVDSEDELLDMLEAPLDSWRVFLHPNQQAIVDANFRGPARVLGGAGTGKTVVAMHRARNLAKRYDGEKILFTTFNRNLATNIGQLMDSLCGPERKQIEVTNIHAWAVGYARKLWGSVKIVSPRESEACWEVALCEKPSAAGWKLDDYAAEWRDVVQFHGVEDEQSYLRVSRAGAKKKLKRPERRQVWQTLAAYRAQLQARGLLDWPDVVRRVRCHLEETGEHPYRAIVVDEAQDIDAEQWRLLAALAPDEDNNLFLTGDAHQRIYGKPIALSQFGIQVRGRSRRLKINYRVTEQVLRFATGLIDGVPVDDLDGGNDTILGYHSVYRGPDPEELVFDNAEQEAKLLVERVLALCELCPPEEIAVVAKTKAQVKRFAQLLAGADIPQLLLDADAHGPGVRVATMHRVKGLDFSHVVMRMPTKRVAVVTTKDKSLMYVASTRCRRTLTVLAPSA